VRATLRRSGQMDWLHYAKYSRFHPDNLNKLPLTLPERVKAPPPLVELSETDKQLGYWGNRLCCEKAFGPVETTVRMKDQVRARSRYGPHRRPHELHT
jgi:hypothetical protein